MRNGLLTEKARYPMFFYPGEPIEIIGEIDVSMEGDAIFLVKKHCASDISGANANITAYIDRRKEGYSKWIPYDDETTLEDCLLNAKLDRPRGLIWLREEEFEFIESGNKGLKGMLTKLEVD